MPRIELLGKTWQHRHAGLLMDRYLCVPKDFEKPSDGAKQQLLNRASLVPIPDGYAEAFELRRQGFEELVAQGRLSLNRAEVLGRLAVGLGARGSLESGLRLEHTWGVPILPGSALKGVAAAAAHLLAEGEAWRKPPGWPQCKRRSPPTSYEELFGTTDEGGYVIFHDAWWKPCNGMLPLVEDVMTVHHPKYYQEAPGSHPPSDMDSPTPIPFLAVRGSFLIGLEGPEAWRDAAIRLLEHGLRELGIGAKTSSGYGRLRLTPVRTRAQDLAAELTKVPQHGKAWEITSVLKQCLRGWAPDRLSRSQRSELAAMRQAIGSPRVESIEQQWPELREFWAVPLPPTAPTQETEHWERGYAWIEGAADKSVLVVREGAKRNSRKVFSKPKKLRNLESDVVLALTALGCNAETETAIEYQRRDEKLLAVRAPQG